MNESEILKRGTEFLQNGEHYNEQKISSSIGILREILQYHNKKYYLEDKPIISDQQYDRLFRLLQNWEEEYPKLKTPDSPTARIDLTVQSELKKVEHLSAMLSLENAFSAEELEEWEERILKFLDEGDRPTYTVELKFDGLGISAIYEHNRLSRVATRGNGEVGEDVTENAKTIWSLPLTADFERFRGRKVEIRGEVVLKKSDFEELNSERAKAEEALFSNPRNAASGSIRQLDPNVTAERKLTAFFYQISLWEPKEKQPERYSQTNDILQSLDFLTSPFFRVGTNISEVVVAVEEMKTMKESFDFEIDGAVIKVNERKFQEKIGETGHHPRWAIAYKFPAKQEITKIEAVEWQVGRTGVLTPVAHLEPVDIGGVRVARATLHNADEITKKDFRIGDIVVVERAGDVIPKVVIPLKERRTSRERGIEIPKKCPICESKVIHIEGEVAIRCENFSCPAQLKGRIVHFASKSALDIENLGKETVDLFVEKGFLKNFADLFSLQAERILELEGFREKSVHNLLNGLEEAKRKPLWRFLTALGIPLVGVRTAKDLAREYPVFWNLVRASREKLEQIDGIGPEVSDSVMSFLHTKENQEMFRKLEEVGFPLSSGSERKLQPAAKNSPVAGKTFLFTGTLTTMGRTEAQELVENLGGKTVSSISKNTDFLVCGENPGSKKKKAEELGVKVLSEEEFLRMAEDKIHSSKGLKPSQQIQQKEKGNNLSLF